MIDPLLFFGFTTTTSPCGTYSSRSLANHLPLSAGRVKQAFSSKIFSICLCAQKERHAPRLNRPQDRYKGAISLLERASSVRLKELGENHPPTVDAQVALERVRDHVCAQTGRGRPFYVCSREAQRTSKHHGTPKISLRESVVTGTTNTASKPPPTNQTSVLAYRCHKNVISIRTRRKQSEERSLKGSARLE